VVDYSKRKNIKFVKKFENLSNVSEVRAIEEFERKITAMQKI